MSPYQKLLRFLDLICISGMSASLVLFFFVLIFGRVHLVGGILAASVAVCVFIWRAKRGSKLWEFTHEQRMHEYSARLSEERLKSLSPEEFEKYQNDSYSKNYGWENHSQYDNQSGRELSEISVQKVIAMFNAVISSKIFDVVCFVAGPAVAAYGLFSFLSVDSVFIYNHTSKLMIATGAGLVGFGIVKKMWSR